MRINEGGIEPNAFADLLARQRRILGRNFKTKLLPFSVFSCFLPYIFIHLSIQHNLTQKRKKQENTEKVRSFVLKFLPKIHLCLACNLRIAFGSIPPQVGLGLDRLGWFKDGVSYTMNVYKTTSASLRSELQAHEIKKGNGSNDYPVQFF